MRLSAVADVLSGVDHRKVALDLEVPDGTVLRWVSVARSWGVEGVAEMPIPETSLEGVDPEIPAMSATVAFAGIERTALRAVASACRGASVGELSSYHGADPDEIRDWIAAYVTLGEFGMRHYYRDEDWSPYGQEQVRLGSRVLPRDLNATFLRHLHVRTAGDYSTRLFAMALIYEGRTARQAAEAVGVYAETINRWLRSLLSHGLPGLAQKPAVTLVPRRKDFDARSVAALAATIGNVEMKRRLSVIEMAYRSLSLQEIFDRTGVSPSSCRAFILNFEKDGPDGLSTGDATVTPPLRGDYSSSRLLEIARGMDYDEPGQRSMRGLAALYDGASMIEVARDIQRGLSQLCILVDRFNRIGHGAAETFKWWMRPIKPPPRRPQTPLPLMERDLRKTLEQVRNNYDHKGREAIDIILAAYASGTVGEIAARSRRSERTVRAFIDRFNAEGLLSLEKYRKKVWRKLKKTEVKPPAPRRIPIRTDITIVRVRNAMYRTACSTHRQDLRIVLALYEAKGLVGTLPERMGVTEVELARLAAAFDLYGETFGASSNRRKMLPASWDVKALSIAQFQPEPLASYANVVASLYGGVDPGIIMEEFDISQSELELIVLQFRERGLAGLEDDPLRNANTTRRYRAPLSSVTVADNVGSPIASPVSAVSPVTRKVGRPTIEVIGTLAPKVATPPTAPAVPAAITHADHVRSLYTGKKLRRLEAAREFRRSKNFAEVSEKYGVSAATLEKWVIDYVKSGMAEVDRQAGQ
ncbi:hypothetical protein G6L37_34935 [Agrobacterium rubi]|nr:hypothetical protein [Agrobacterium rubi]NTF23765.1 hypothetical protein [Agrobacterium rubi]